MPKKPFRCSSFVVLGFLSVLILSSSSFAWKTATHAAVANKALDELIPVVPPDGGPALVKFHGIDLNVTYTDAYRAIIEHQDYFIMGNLGPDAFPDLVSGQIYPHPNSGATCNPVVGDSVAFEKRTKPSQFRSIDYAMLLLKKARQSDDDKDLAFAIGYMAHCSVDGFSHTWVNEKAGGAWSYTDGKGLFGPLTEEIKHMAVEGLIDKDVPPSLLSTNPPNADGKTDGNRLNTKAPYDMLDQYYNNKYGGEFVGGMLYNYWELQGDILDHIKTGIDAPLSVLEGVEGIGPGSVESILWLMGRIPGFDIFTGAASEITDLFFSMGNSINPVNIYFNEVRDNIDVLKRENNAYRRNWMVMSSATMENIIKSNVVGNADRCTQVNNDQNLYYGGITGTDLPLFKMEIQKLFELEQGKDYHKLSDNVGRQLNYLLGSFVLKDLPETLIPSAARLAWVEFKQWLIDNYPGILDYILYPIATAVAEAACAEDATVCETHCITNNCAGSIASCIADACDCGLVDPVCWAECATAPVWCPAEAIPGCAGCNANCAWDLGDCTLSNLFNFDSREKLFEAIDDILAPIDQIKQYITDYIISKACDIAMDMGVPIKDLHRVVAIYRTIEKLEQEGKYGFVNFVFLKEDLQDPAWFQKLSEGNPQLEAFLNSIKNGSYTFIGDELATLPIEVPDNCLDLTTTGAFDKDPNFGLLIACKALFDEPGPTASKIEEEAGNNMPETFDPFYNTVQAVKVTPISTQSDVEAAFTNAGADKAMLPWKPAMKDIYSKICSEYPNVFCDAVSSLDDPNCTNCATDKLEWQHFPNPSNSQVTVDWARKRGVVVWNPYNPEDPSWKPYLNTSFVFGTSNNTIDKLYCKIFRMPTNEPTWTTLDDNPPKWTNDNGGVSSDTTNKTQGNGSMQVKGCNYMLLRSPKTSTTEFGMLSHTLSIDIYIPAQVSNSYWLGAVQLYFDIPAANLNNCYIEQKELTGLNKSAWNTISFTLPDSVYKKLNGDYPNCEVRIALNIPGCNDGYRIDNMAFTGDVKPRDGFHTTGGRNLNVSGNSLFSFDNSGDWTSQSAQIAVVSTPREEGTGATSVTGGGWIPIKSRTFNASEMTNVTNRLNLDLYIPAPQPNPWWVGDVSLTFSCPSAGLNNVPIGREDLTHCFYEEYNSLIFNLPANVVNTLKNNATGCSFEIDLNVNNGTGAFLLDKMGFVQQ